jgi:FkbH-like protein
VTTLDESCAKETAPEAAARLLKGGRVDEARALLLAEAANDEHARPEVALALAKISERAGDASEAVLWALDAARSSDHTRVWQSVASLIGRHPETVAAIAKRQARMYVAASSTTSAFLPLLTVAAAQVGVAIEVYEGAYGQYQQDVLDASSPLYSVDPDIVLFAVEESQVRLPDRSDDPESAVVAEAARWTSLWRTTAERSRARILVHGFVVPPERPLGHLSPAVPGSRATMLASLNARLAASAEDRVRFVDCDWVASLVGKERWFDPRYWHLAKHAVSPVALPSLARHTAAVAAATLGLTKKCLVLDLDNTLWGGVIGEDGLGGIRLGDGVAGEAYVAFQEYVLALKRRGVLLAVVSKNNERDAREPFERHAEMRIRLDDVAVFLATWEPKPDQLREVASRLGIGLDSLVFVDDNPVERQAVRRFCPEVDVITLPEDPSGYVRALAAYLLFEPAALTDEDVRRTEQYRALADAQAARQQAASIEEFLDDLAMVATVRTISELDRARVVQLLGKTNQFNVTTRRHGAGEIDAFTADPRSVHLTFRLADRYDDHGLVGVLLARGDERDEVLEVDTWLMSCRVLGRTLEATMLHELCLVARERGYGTIAGTYVRTAKNGLVADVFGRHGFELVADDEDGSRWSYDLRGRGPVPAAHIRTVREEITDR